MRIAAKSIKALQRVITGDPLPSGEPIAPYQSGPDLVAFFNDLGFSDEYLWGGGSPSRWMYCEGKLEEINGSDRMLRAVEAALDPRRFLDTEFDVDAAALYLNRFLRYDGFRVDRQGLKYAVHSVADDLVVVEPDLDSSDPVSKEFMQQQLSKCRRKVEAGDFDGAVTSARALLESVLLEMNDRLGGDQDFKGDLPKLYKVVRRQLNLDPSGDGVDQLLLPIMTGLTSIVGGLAGLRNRLGDAHARRYRTRRHHARLAVNTAYTLVDFLLDSFAIQHGDQVRGGPDA